MIVRQSCGKHIETSSCLLGSPSSASVSLTQWTRAGRRGSKRASMSERWREQYERLKRWQARLKEPAPVDDRRLDDYHAFFICCFHLKDWLRADPLLSPTIGPAAEAWLNDVKYLRLCADLANASKHLVIDRKVRIDPNIAVRAVQGAF